MKEIDMSLTPILCKLKKNANDIDMPLICNTTQKDIIKKQNYQGIYRIDISTQGTSISITDWIENFRRKWEHEDYKKKFTPNLKKKRIARHTVLLDWMPLYLGKSKNVGARVLEHIEIPLNKPTFALKLNARHEMKKYHFRLHAIRIDVTNYDLIAPVLEAALRDRFHPLIGKQ